MGLYDHWPYTNFHELNLSWLLRRMEYLSNVVENFVALNTIKYADPIQWNITTQYEANTVVVDPQTGTAYISSRPVPAGVGLTNTDYWSVIFTLDVISANKNITLRDDGSNVLSTFSSAAGDWLLWNGTLYRVSQAINVNEAYVVGYNLDRYTVEMFISDYINMVLNVIGDLTDLNTTDKDSIVDAINEVLQKLNDTTGNLNDLSTTDKDNLVDAINELYTDITTLLHPYATPEEYGAEGDGSTDDAQALYDALTSGRPVLLKESTSYYIGSTLYIANDFTMIGKNSELIFEANNTTIIGAATGAGPSIRIHGKCTIEGVKFTHINGAADNVNSCLNINEPAIIQNCTFQDITASAIYIQASDTMIKECDFNACGYYGVNNFRATIYCSGPIINVRIDKCRFNNVHRGIIFRGGEMGGADWLTRSSITDCIIIGAGNMFADSSVLGIGCGMVKNITIKGNYISNFYSNLVDLHGFDYAVITDNFFDYGNGDAVFVGDESFSGAIITNNIFHSNYRGIRVLASIAGRVCYRTVISNNDFENITTDGILIEATDATAYTRDVIVTDNHFYLCGVGVNCSAQSAGAKNVQHVKIANCEFYRTKNGAIKMRYTNFIAVSECEFIDGAYSTPTVDSMIYIADSDHQKINDCKFLGSGLNCIELPSSNSSTNITDNLYRSVTNFLDNQGTATVTENNLSW